MQDKNEFQIRKTTPTKDVIQQAECSRECNACKNGCRHGGGTLAEEDVPKLAEFLGISVEKLQEQYLESITRFNTTLWKTKSIKKDKPYGNCVFFDNGCTIHEVKPTECKIAHCSEKGQQHSIWFALNHFVNTKDKQSLKEWQTYLELGHPTIPGGSMEELKNNDLGGQQK